jgi:hypothetical protein
MQTPTRPDRRRLLKYLLLAIVCGYSLITLQTAWATVQTYGMDLQQDYLAARNLRAGASIYRPFAQDEMESLGISVNSEYSMVANAHPPGAIWMFVPLSWLPFGTVAVLWTLLCAGLMVGCVVLIVRELELPLSTLDALILGGLLINWRPLVYHWLYGQLNIVVLACCLAGWVAARRGRDGLAGLAVGVSVLIKAYPAILLAWAIYRRRWRMAAAGALTLGLAFLIQPGAWLEFFRTISPATTAEWGANRGNLSLLGLSHRIFTGTDIFAPLIDRPGWELPARLALYGLAGAALAVTFWRRRASLSLDGEWSLLFIAMLIFSPISWIHNMLFLFLPLAYLWKTVLPGPPRAQKQALLITALTVAIPMLQTNDWIAALYDAYSPERIPGIYNLLTVPIQWLFLVLYGYFIWREYVLSERIKDKG